jgi:hypothetical protein
MTRDEDLAERARALYEWDARLELLREVDRLRQLKSDHMQIIRGMQETADRLSAEIADHRALFDLQWTRMGKATELWRQEDPGARDLILPDLGELLDWLIARGDFPSHTEKGQPEQ